ncbi:MAG TPA: (d)CMP kinase [Actinomycetota bacterium]
MMGTTVIAIDGPAGSGKSTLARRLALELGLPYVNTGLMYRAVAARALEEGLDLDDEASLAATARELRFDLDPTVRPAELTVDGGRPEASLSSPEVESTVSRVARHPEVREVLRQDQRRLAAGGAVMEGRDIGTVVAPDAALKVFLQAHPEQRSRRRARERDAPAQETAEAISARDAQDARTNPFVPAPDAVVLDTTRLSAEESFRRAMELVRKRGLRR